MYCGIAWGFPDSIAACESALNFDRISRNPAANADQAIFDNGSLVQPYRGLSQIGSTTLVSGSRPLRHRRRSLPRNAQRAPCDGLSQLRRAAADRYPDTQYQCALEHNDIGGRLRCGAEIPPGRRHAKQSRAARAGVDILVCKIDLLARPRLPALDMQGNACLIYRQVNTCEYHMAERRDADLLFKALADPSRRKLLDLLHAHDGRTLNDLCEHLDMTRQGVTQHLDLLEAANLIATARRGREKRHFLNPVPLQEIYERWIAKFEKPRLKALGDLKRRLEKSDG